MDSRGQQFPTAFLPSPDLLPMKPVFPWPDLKMSLPDLCQPEKPLQDSSPVFVEFDRNFFVPCVVDRLLMVLFVSPRRTQRFINGLKALRELRVLRGCESLLTALELVSIRQTCR